MSTADASQGRFELRTDAFTWQHWAVLALAAVTGIIHLWLVVQYVPEPLGWAFLVAVIGFFVGIVAILVDYRRRLVYLLGIPFTAGQIVAWYALNDPPFGAVDYTDKAVQVVLIVLLVLLYRRASGADVA